MTSAELAKKLHAAHFNASEFKQLTLATDEQLAELKPQDGELCHELAERWVGVHPQHRVVRGFLVINECCFHKHSVVDTGSRLLDVTPRNPNEASPPLRFIVCDGVSRAVFGEWLNQVILLNG